MTSRELARKRLRLVSDGDRLTGPTSDARAQIPLQCDWQRLLTDLTTFGVVRIRVANAIASLASQAEPRRAFVGTAGALVAGPGIHLLAALRNLSAATIENGHARAPDDHVLRFLDWRGEEALGVYLTEDSDWSHFHALLVRQWARRGVPLGVAGESNENVAAALAEFADSIDLPAKEMADRWCLARDGEGCAPLTRIGRRVDPSLITPFLEVIAEQSCRMQVSVGNGGVQHRHATEFYECRSDGPLTLLRGATATFSMARERVTTASVVRLMLCDRPRQVLRLFDERWRTVATLMAEPEDNRSDPPLWTTLINALVK